MKPFQVVVSNIGHVYDGSNFMQARAVYNRYIKFSKDGIGVAAGEDVTLFHGEHIRCEFFGERNRDARNQFLRRILKGN